MLAHHSNETRCTPKLPSVHKERKEKEEKSPASRKSEFMRDCDPCLVSSRQKWFSFLENLYYHSVAMEGEFLSVILPETGTTFLREKFSNKEQKGSIPVPFGSCSKSRGYCLPQTGGICFQGLEEDIFFVSWRVSFWKKLFKQC
ncbi:hypothetical protein CEXT_457861 [Caerostris extrusa]|uniref:Maturase K n=1 Tax=Caerostris extrusa TaxID=172846 RepID=A0AAV4P3I4_CAEEX|nr:hypothetical protein CEXT_457861 [Caerostris extrusa]